MAGPEKKFTSGKAKTLQGALWNNDQYSIQSSWKPKDRAQRENVIKRMEDVIDTLDNDDDSWVREGFRLFPNQLLGFKEIIDEMVEDAEERGLLNDEKDDSSSSSRSRRSEREERRTSARGRSSRDSGY